MAQGEAAPSLMKKVMNVMSPDGNFVPLFDTGGGFAVIRERTHPEMSGYNRPTDTCLCSWSTPLIYLTAKISAEEGCTINAQAEIIKLLGRSLSAVACVPLVGDRAEGAPVSSLPMRGSAAARSR